MMDVLIEKVLPNPEQPRTVFDDEGLAGLARSIEVHGVILPISVEEAEDGFFILHDGERRLLAARMAGLKRIPATVEKSLNETGPRERLERAMVANLQRDDMNPIDEAKAYARLRDEHDMTVREISERTGIYEARIHSRLILSRADAEIQELVAEGKLSHCGELIRNLLEIPDKNTRVALARKIVDRKMTVRGSVKAAKRICEALRANDSLEKGATPAMQLAWKNVGRPVQELPNWDSLQQLGQVPPWKVIEQSALDTCEMCVLREIASKAVCAECGLVAMLQRLIRRGL